MRLAYPALALALALASTSACTIDWGGDDDIICPLAQEDDEGLRAPDPGLLNPWNLQCEFFGGGGDGCRGVPAEADPIAIPTWASCESSCTGLDEATCIATPACRTAYDHDCLLTDGPCPALTPFLGCFGVDTTGPIQGTCEGLDAFACSRHDDCLATYSESNGVRQFELCLPELRPDCEACN